MTGVFPGLSKQMWPRENSADLDAFYGPPTPSGTNLVTVTIPWKCTAQHVEVNQKVAASLERVLAAYWDFVGRDNGRIAAQHLDICDGAFNYRRNKNNPSVLSMHSYGCAIDWAAAYNPNGSSWHDGGSMLPIEFIEAFQAEGWSWGGEFHGTKDPMHFEATALGQGSVVGSGGDSLPLQFGDKGPLVIQVQQKLGIAVDGVFGSATRASVQAFQQVHGLDVDGVVTDATWAALGTGSTPSQQRSLSAGAAIYQKLLNKFQQSNVVGVIPPDAAQFGITSGSAYQWAIFGTAVADAESGFDPHSANTSDPGGSFGIFQYAHNQVPGGNAFDVDASIDAFVRDAESSAHRGLQAGILGQRFSTIGRHPDRTVAKLGEAKKLAASIPVPTPITPPSPPPPTPDLLSALWQRIQQLEQKLATVTTPTPTAPPGTTLPVPISPTPPPQIDLARLEQEIAKLGQIAATFSQLAQPLSQLPMTGMPPQFAQLEQITARLGQAAGSFSQSAAALSGQSLGAATAGSASSTAQPLSPIDKLLGGEAMVGLKTPLAIGAYALIWILQAAGVMGSATGDGATTTGSVLTALVSAFGAMGVTAKFDRAFQSLTKISAAASMISRV